MATFEQIETAARRYIVAEVLTQVTDPGTRMLAGVGAGLVIHNKLKKFESMNGQLEALGVLDENGQLDVDIAAEMAKGAIPVEGWKIELPNTGGIKLPTFTFTAEDIDVLRRYIEGVSK